MRLQLRKILTLLVTIFIFTVVHQTVTLAESTGSLRYEVVSETRQEIYDGVTHIHATANSINDAGAITRQNVNVLVKDVDAHQVQLVSWAKFVNGRWRLAPLDEIAKDFEAHNPGWKVIAGINGDFFTTSGSINMHMTMYGDILKYNNSYLTVGIKGDGTHIQAVKNLEYGDYFLTAYDPDTHEILFVKEIDGINNDSLEESQTIVLHNRGEFDIPKTYKFLVEHPDIIHTSDGLYFLKGKVTSSTTQIVPTNSTNFTIVTNESDVREVLFKRPYIRIQKLLHNFYPFDTAIGGNLPILLNDKVLTVDEMLNEGSTRDFITARHPRSSIGISEDGKLVLGIIDGRQKDAPGGIESHGVDLRELAEMMKQYGAVSAFNLDGGHSSQMVVRDDNGEFKYINSPSQSPRIGNGQLREDANGLLLVVPDVSVKTSYENLGYDHLDLSYAIHPTEGVEIVSTYLGINGDRLQLTENIDTLNLTGLNYGLNFFNFIITYKKDGKEFTRTYSHKIFDLSKNRSTIEPSFEIEFDHQQEAAQLQLTIHITDPDFLVESLKVQHGDKEPISATIENNRATVTIANPEVGEHTFRIIYTDQEKNDHSYEETFKYTVKPENNGSTDNDNNDKKEKDKSFFDSNLVIWIAVGSLGIVVLVGVIILIVDVQRRKKHE